ncbi:hypothetical protein [Vampirovibrio chlorellavorus]|uniref:hypothetical protein n=1 Tax=Vampirovibrio chlorellavorus TaxID=758823 RepID=UPI0026F27993|nr:hypothetical protein [Vampirovibrio chlorellavorus]
MGLQQDGINLKRLASNFFAVILDFKILGLIVLNILLIYMGTWDTVLRPCMEQMEARTKGLEEQKKLLAEREGLEQQYSTLEKQLKSMRTELIPVPAGNSSKVVAVTEAAEILELVKGNKREETVLPRLLPPHDQRSEASLTFLSSAQMDLLKPDGADANAGNGSAGAAAPSQAPSSPDAAPANPELAGAGSAGGTSPEASQGVPFQIGSTTLPVERFDYELKVSGTYPALVDVLNELVIRKKLIRINKVTISRPEKVEDPQPAAADNPEFPVKLNMVANISMYLYAHGNP